MCSKHAQRLKDLCAASATKLSIRRIISTKFLNGFSIYWSLPLIGLTPVDSPSVADGQMCRKLSLNGETLITMGAAKVG